MISIKPINIPLFLRNSAFFSNLTDDEEEITIPQECGKPDTTVTNVADLDNLLGTLRFWGAERIPHNIVTYVITIPENMWGHVLREYEKDLHFVRQLLEVIKCERDGQVCKAVELENAEIVKVLLDHQYPVEYQSGPNMKRAVDIAVQKGNMEILKILRQSNCPYSDTTSKAAASVGNQGMLEFIIQDGCPNADDLVNFAFASGNISCLQYAYLVLGCAWTNNLFQEVTSADLIQNNGKEEGLVQCLKFTLAHGCPVDPHACKNCANLGYPLLLQHLHETGWPWDKKVVEAAARQGHLTCLKYAIECGCPLPYQPFWEAMLSGNVETIQYLHDRGFPWPIKPLCFHYGDHETAKKVLVCLTYAYKLGCPRDLKTGIYASNFGWYEMLTAEDRHASEWSTYCTAKAAGNGHLNCLTYLHEHGCPWDESTTAQALEHGQVECLKYAIEHGCPTSSDTLIKYQGLVELEAEL